ncbi:MAG: alkaline phosphatase family protein [Myxococcota bacterium]
MKVHGPERIQAQGLVPEQEESGNRAILALLEDPQVRDQVDLVITCRAGVYEVWATRGMVRFRRIVDGEGLRYEVLEQLGVDPLAQQDPSVLSTLAEELRVAGLHATGGDGPGQAGRCYFEPEQVSYPFAHERIAQLFDSPLAPDLIVSPRAYTFGQQAGQHGALDVVQSRATLSFAGPRMRPGRYPRAARRGDGAPTLCRALDFPEIDGLDAAGRPARTYLRRQDGRVLEEILDPDAPPPERVYVMLLDGMSHTELLHQLDDRPEAIPNLRRLLERAAIPAWGSIVNFPSITWPSHSTLLTGAWCGHHDLVNPSYYVRETREVANPQGQTFETEGYLGEGVETLYEVFTRVRGAFTAAVNEPQGRGATHASLERRTIGDRTRLKARTAELRAGMSERWRKDGFEDVAGESYVDVRGLAQVEVLFDDPAHPAPELVVHEFALTDGAGHAYGPHGDGLREALAETDRRVGVVLDLLERRGLYEGTLFVVVSDHGMADQDVSLRGNPARHPERLGMRATTCEPMIWLRDLRVEIVRKADGRTARVCVSEADPDRNGRHPPVPGVQVEASDRLDRRFASAKTDAEGRAALTTPPDIASDQIVLRVEHPDFNPRHVLVSGRSLAPDPRRLYARVTGG